MVTVGNHLVAPVHAGPRPGRAGFPVRRFKGARNAAARLEVSQCPVGRWRGWHSAAVRRLPSVRA
ncbi:hypothetical protein GCM10010442_64370 [Kitasatospora kifunensis]